MKIKDCLNKFIVIYDDRTKANVQITLFVTKIAKSGIDIVYSGIFLKSGREGLVVHVLKNGGMPYSWFQSRVELVTESKFLERRFIEKAF